MRQKPKCDVDAMYSPKFHFDEALGVQFTAWSSGNLRSLAGQLQIPEDRLRLTTSPFHHALRIIVAPESAELHSEALIDVFRNGWLLRSVVLRHTVLDDAAKREEFSARKPLLLCGTTWLRLGCEFGLLECGEVRSEYDICITRENGVLLKHEIERRTGKCLTHMDLGQIRDTAVWKNAIVEALGCSVGS